jgi:DNA-binding response OmpR family regulator
MKRILIIEDDARITAALTVRLQAAGFAVLSAPDGFQGLKAALTGKPDLILLDIVLPVGLGFSVAARLRELGLKTPVIFLTASKRTGLRRTAAQLRAAGFFEKPYDAEELMAAIALILGVSLAPPPSAALPTPPAPRL